MKEIKGNIWDYHDKGHWIVITTNGTVKKNGEAVMGRGIALEAKQKYPKLPSLLGNYMVLRGKLHLEVFADIKIISFPTKWNWYEKSDIQLIEESAFQLKDWVDYTEKQKLLKGFEFLNIPPVYMTRPGCGNGGLDWKDVKPILERCLDDRFIIVQL